MPEISLITWKDKVNSPELLAYLEQFGDEHYLTAEQINEFKEKLNALISNGTVATNTDMLPEGVLNLYFTEARVLKLILKGISITSVSNPLLNLKLIDKGSTNGVRNTGEGLEINDVVRGFFDANTYWKAAYYLGGNVGLRSSWQPVEESITVPNIPDIPNPDPPVDPPEPGVRNFSDNFSSIHFKIYY